MKVDIFALESSEHPIASLLLSSDFIPRVGDTLELTGRRPRTAVVIRVVLQIYVVTTGPDPVAEMERVHVYVQS